MIRPLSLSVIVTVTMAVQGNTIGRQHLTVESVNNTFWDEGENNDSSDRHNESHLQIIFPGTLWCGPGNIADNDSELGYFEETDRCCQKHDHCDGILAGETKYGLTNDSPYTK